MGLRSFNILSLCSGYGGLDLGVGLAVPTAVTVCYVEREAYANAVLVSRIQDETLDDAPIWSDLRTFDGRPWRGVVDCIIGGYPCQPFSVAGKQLGASDSRHLWPDIARIVREVRPEFCFFENVRQHINIGLEQVRADLRAMGYRVEGGIFSAAEVGAPHRRERLFLLAHAEIGGQHTGAKLCQPTRERHPELGVLDVAHADRERGPQSQGGIGQQRGWPLDGEQAMAHTDETRLEGRYGPLGSSTDERAARPSSPALADAPSTGRNESRPTRIGQLPAKGGEGVDHRPRLDGPELGIFPPGPADFDEWAVALDEYPELAPALESPVRGVADGPASHMAGRAEQLRLGGNGVVPLQAAYAFAVLAARAGLSYLLDAAIGAM